MRPYDDFLSEVTPYVHDVPEFVAVNAVRNACIEFCTKSEWVQYTVPDIAAVALQAAYAFASPTDTVPVRIVQCWYGTRRLTPKSPDQLNDQFSVSWRSRQGLPEVFTQLENVKQVTVVPYPAVIVDAASDVIRLLVATAPTRDSTTVDDSVFDRWFEEIGWGARARLLDTPGQPYSDVGASMRLRAAFASAISSARIERNRGLTHAPLRVRMPQAI